MPQPRLLDLSQVTCTLWRYQPAIRQVRRIHGGHTDGLLLAEFDLIRTLDTYTP